MAALLGTTAFTATSFASDDSKADQAGTGVPGGAVQTTTAPSPREAPTVSGVRVGSHPKKTRVVLDLSGKADFTHKVSDDGKSVVFNFSQADWKAAPFSRRHRHGVITNYAFAKNPKGGGLLKISSTAPVEVRRTLFFPPNGKRGHRLVIDLVENKSFAPSAPKPPQSVKKETIDKTKKPAASEFMLTSRVSESITKASSFAKIADEPDESQVEVGKVKVQLVDKEESQESAPESMPESMPAETTEPEPEMEAAPEAAPEPEETSMGSDFKGLIKGLYVKLGTAYSVVPDTEGVFNGVSLQGEDTDNTWLVEGGLGYRYNRNVRTDVVYTYRPGIDGSNTGTSGASQVTTEHDNMTLLVNGYYDILSHNGFTPYVGAGIGLARNDSDDAHTVATGADYQEGGDTSYDLSWMLTVGTGYKITDELSLDLAYRFIDLGDFSQSGTFSGTGAPGANGGTEMDNDYAHEIVLGVRYEF